MTIVIIAILIVAIVMVYMMYPSYDCTSLAHHRYIGLPCSTCMLHDGGYVRLSHQLSLGGSAAADIDNKGLMVHTHTMHPLDV